MTISACRPRSSTRSRAQSTAGGVPRSWLHLDGDLFIRDPIGVLRADTVRAYDGHATLPKAARSTGYHEGGRTIWRVATDHDSIYVVTSDGVERWPRAKDNTMGCA